MLGQIEQETNGWLPETSVSWSDDLSHLSLEKTLFSTSESEDGFFDKAHDDKLARDVEDLSMIFEELDGGVVDFPLPCDVDEITTETEVTEDWVGELETDAMNVDELSTMFDVLAAEQCDGANAEDLEEKAQPIFSDDDDEDMNSEEDTHTIPPQIVYTPPVWAQVAPLDPRSVIRTPVFKNLDSRIPRIAIPRIDLGFGGANSVVKPVSSPLVSQPKSPKTKTTEYQHDPATCWICKSDKSPYKKICVASILGKASSSQLETWTSLQWSQ